MKKGLIIRIFLVLGIVLLLGIGVSYSLWNISASQDRVNTAMTSCFDITYSSESSAINLEKQYPISDEAGSKLTPYTFKITNNCDINAYYKINLETLNTSNIDTKFMKASLNNENPKIISNYDDTNTSLKEGKVANTLKSGYLPVGGSISFDLRVWIDYDTTVNDIKNDGTDKWVGKIVVISSPVTEDEINKVCQSHGGDLIEGGECRKYYVKLNNFVDFKNIEFGYVPSDNLPINHVYDGNAKKWTISYQGKNKWFGIHVYDVAKNFNHSFYGKYNLNYSTCLTAMRMDAKAIFAYTHTGRTVKNLAGFLPKCPIYAITDNKTIYKQLALIFGVRPIYVETKDSIEDMIKDGVEIAEKVGVVKKGDLVAVAGGASILTDENNHLMNKTIGGILKI